MKAKFVYESVFVPKSEEEISTSIKNLSQYEKTEMLKKALIKDDKFLIKKLVNFLNVKEFNRDVRDYDYEQLNPDNFHFVLLKLLLRDTSGENLKLFIDNGFVPLTRNLNVDWEIRNELEQILKDNIQHKELIKLLNTKLYDELMNTNIKVSYDQQFRKSIFNESMTKEILLKMVTEQLKYAFDTLKIPMLNLEIRDSREMDPVMWTSEHDHLTWEVYSTAPVMVNGFEAKNLSVNFEKLANKDNERKRYNKETVVYLKVNNGILRRRDQGLDFEKSPYDSKKLNMLYL